MKNKLIIKTINIVKISFSYESPFFILKLQLLYHIDYLFLLKDLLRILFHFVSFI